MGAMGAMMPMVPMVPMMPMVPMVPMMPMVPMPHWRRRHARCCFPVSQVLFLPCRQEIKISGRVS
jgi:hypothetical protein